MKSSNVTSLNNRAKTRSVPSSPSEFRDQIVGKRIEAVVAKPGKDGQPPMVLMMQFDDGSVVEWVSPRSDTVLRRALSHRTDISVNSSTNHEVGTLPLPLLEWAEPRHARS